MFPLTYLDSARSMKVTVQLKNGEDYMGDLKSCDGWMNICLQNVICTSPDGSYFWKMSECYILGVNVNSFQVPEEAAQLAYARQGKIYPIYYYRGRAGFRGGRGGGRAGFYEGHLRCHLEIPDFI